MSDEKNSSPDKPSPEASTPEAPGPDKPKSRKDAWDKAQIIFSATSSVVLATVALLVNSTIQKTQQDAAKETARAQTRSENAKLTSELMQHLLSSEGSRQRIALIALKRAVRDDDDMVVDIVSVVANTSHDEQVFKQAIDVLSASKSLRVSAALSEISKEWANSKGSTENARIASAASQHVAIKSTLPAGTAAPPLVLPRPLGSSAGASLSTKIGTVELSRFAGLEEGDSEAKATALFGAPVVSASSSKNPLAYGAPPFIFVHAWFMGSVGISGITVYEAGVTFVKSKAGSDPVLELMGKSKDAVISLLGQPNVVSTVAGSAEAESWYLPVWNFGHGGNLHVAFQSGVCKYITLNWR